MPFEVTGLHIHEIGFSIGPPLLLHVGYTYRRDDGSTLPGSISRTLYLDPTEYPSEGEPPWTMELTTQQRQLLRALLVRVRSEMLEREGLA